VAQLYNCYLAGGMNSRGSRQVFSCRSLQPGPFGCEGAVLALSTTGLAATRCYPRLGVGRQHADPSQQESCGVRKRTPCAALSYRF